MKKAHKMLVSLLFVSIALAVISPCAFSSGEKKLYLYSWSQYMDPAIIKNFEEKYNVDVVQTFYNSLGEMFAKMNSGGSSQYDVLVSSNYYVPRLIHQNLIQPLKKDIVTNLDNLLPKFRGLPFDLTNNKYTAAYQWITTGIAYNASKLKNMPKSWGILFNPKYNSRYPFVLSTDPVVVLSAACAYLGYGYPCKNDKQWKDAAQLILKTTKRSNFIGFYDSTPIVRMLQRGNAVAGIVYNGDYMFEKMKDKKEFSDIKYVLPKEGTEVGIDYMMVPRNAPHPVLANKFINFMLKPKIGAELSNYNKYASPNAAAEPFLDKVVSKPPITPTASEMEDLHLTPALKGKELKLVHQLWAAIKSS